MAKSVRSTPGKNGSGRKEDTTEEKETAEKAASEEKKTGEKPARVVEERNEDKAAGSTESSEPKSEAQEADAGSGSASSVPNSRRTAKSGSSAATDDTSRSSRKDDEAPEGGEGSATDATGKGPSGEKPDASSETETAGKGAPPPAAATRAPEQTPRVARGPGFMTLLLGGVLAGAIGFAVAWYYPDLIPRAETPPDPAVTALQERVAEQGDRIEGTESRAEDLAGSVSALIERVDTMQGAAPEVTEADLRAAVGSDLDAMSSRLDQAETRLDELANRVGALSDSVAEGGGTVAPDTAALADAEARLQALQSDLQAQQAAVDEALEAARARADEIAAAAEARAGAIRAEAALSRLQAAVLGGGSFGPALAEIETALSEPIPQALVANAEAGVPTLPQLQRQFPAAARAALEAALEAEAGDGSALDRIGSFLRAQTGARSLTEREGNDADAVLSRAEARLAEGDLAASLSELEALGEAGRTAMSDWLDAAQTRQDALDAVETLSAALASQ